jgi:hypothetical protein
MLYYETMLVVIDRSFRVKRMISGQSEQNSAIGFGVTLEGAEAPGPDFCSG